MTQEAFHARFGPGPIWLSRAPGRVNLIGEHTDYNGGYVLPMAIDREIRMEFRPNEGGRVELYSIDLDESHGFDLNNLDKKAAPEWAHYIMGVVHVLQAEGHTLTGMEATIHGTIPMGAGLSSSAALEVATAMSFNHACDLKINRVKMAELCQRAENEFVGVNCGIMDQFASLLCRKDHALLIDCTTLDFELAPLDSGKVRIMVCNTMVKHALIDSPYNQRRQTCAKAFHILCQHLTDMTPKSYRDIPIAALKSQIHNLDDPMDRRARHVVTENERVRHMVRALERNDFITAGALMDASHESLRTDYEVSCEELDIMVECAREHHGAFGARMTGGGFGGCVVALVNPEAAEGFCDHVASAYQARTGIEPTIFEFHPAEGATVEKVTS
jgi:galactokinase